ncbi:MAG: DUF3307 domain-containing protein [Endomicrobiales bacterium]
MYLFWLLVLAHLLADFTFQSAHMVGWKRKSLLGGVVHSLVFFLCGAVLSFAYLDRAWLTPGGIAINGWTALALLTLFHFLEDLWRVWTIRERGSRDSLFFFLLDQFIHLALIFIIFPVQTAVLPGKWVLLAIVFVLVTHFSSIGIYYLEKEITGSSELVPREKYLSMAERFAAGLLLLLPGWWALSFPAAWGLRVFARRKSGPGHSPFSAAVNCITAVFFGLIARLIVHA